MNPALTFCFALIRRIQILSIPFFPNPQQITQAIVKYMASYGSKNE